MSYTNIIVIAKFCIVAQDSFFQIFRFAEDFERKNDDLQMRLLLVLDEQMEVHKCKIHYFNTNISITISITIYNIS